MKDQILKIEENAKLEIQKAETLQALNEARVKFLGKKGELTAVLRGMGALSAEERPIIGSFVNETRDLIENLIEEKENKLKQQALNEKLSKEKIDITMPSKKTEIGSIHPLVNTLERRCTYSKKCPARPSRRRLQSRYNRLLKPQILLFAR